MVLKDADFEVEGTLDYKNISIFGSIFQYKNIAISIIYHPWKKNILSIANSHLLSA